MASLKDFQKQLKYTVNNTPNADSSLLKLANNFCTLSNPTNADFNKFVADTKAIKYSAKSGALSSPVTNLILVEEKSLADAGSAKTLFKASNKIVYQCVISKGNFMKPEFEVKPLAGPVNSQEDYLVADKACKAFAAEKTGHYISHTASASDCKGPIMGDLKIHHECMLDYSY